MTDEFSEADKQLINEMELDNKVGSECSRMLVQFAADLKKKAGELAWQVCNDYVEYAEFEPFSNWKDRARSELLKEQYWKKPEDYWGGVMRNTIYQEHKEELLPLIRDDQMARLEKELVDLKKQLQFERNLNLRRDS